MAISIKVWPRLGLKQRKMWCHFIENYVWILRVSLIRKVRQLPFSTTENRRQQIPKKEQSRGRRLTYACLRFTDTLYRKSGLSIPRNETAQPRTQFLCSCIYEQFIYSQDRSAYFFPVPESHTQMGSHSAKNASEIFSCLGRAPLSRRRLGWIGSEVYLCLMNGVKGEVEVAYFR
jgi:hypothetical protein